MTARAFLASLLIAGLMVAPAASANPVAEARGNEFLTRYVQVGTTVQLDGTHSYGADCTLSYSWSMVSRPSGSSAAISSPGSVHPTFVPDRVGDYVIELVVGDSSGTSDPVRITVSAITGSQFPLPAKNANRWMTLTPKIMDRTLPQITLPGTHDSGAYWLDLGRRGPDFNDQGFDASWFLEVLAFGSLSDEDAVKNEVARDVALAHSSTLLQQLRSGIRHFDLRVTIRDNVFYVYHGLLGRPLTELLQDLRIFLEQSEREFVVVNVSHLAVGTHETSNHRALEANEHQSLMQLLVDYLGPHLYPRNGQTPSDVLATSFGRIVEDGPKALVIYSDDYFYKCDDETGICNFGPARYDPHFEQFWHDGVWLGGSTNTEKLTEQVDGQQSRFAKYLAGTREKGFRLFQTLTVSTEFGDTVGTNAIKCRVGEHLPWWHPVLPTTHLATKIALLESCDKTRTLHELSRPVNRDLPRMLRETFAPSGTWPALILVDYFEESAVVSEALRLNQRDTTAPTTSAARNPPANRYGGGFGDVTVTLSALDEAGGSGIAGMHFETEGAQSSSGEWCGARTQLLITAKGLTTINYAAWDREGNSGPEQTLQVRIDRKCDFNRDGKTDAADRTGLLRSLSDGSIMFPGDLDEDGRYTTQEWVRCWYHLYKGYPL